ncbi:Crp/Fnr family transcriptional regulator [Frankia sp. AiPs1]|uniref:Crp/Fnr family transcriptional regulator n=1 Tax=Frankia sp. AiPs1 TaxID=573493 RepID=UPI00204376DF|nr:Crp/Fnr family transcriptional regulator [Frankia sp. AiPs1]MCM3920322.1 Crp/Fnr family transcriptional regulator [Frankia sp. AiPs1]
MAAGSGVWSGQLLDLLDAAGRAAALTLGVEQVLDSDAVIVWQDKPADEVLLLVTGWARSTSITPSGRVLLHDLHHPGDVLAERPGGPRTATVTAGSTVRLRRIAHCDVRGFLAANPGAGAAWRQSLCPQRRAARRAWWMAPHLPVPRRVARLLLEEHRTFGQDGIPLVRRDLAAMLGRSASTVQAAVSGLREAGAVDVVAGSRRIHIIDVAALRLLAGEPAPVDDLHCPPGAEGCVVCGEGW